MTANSEQNNVVVPKSTLLKAYGAGDRKIEEQIRKPFSDDPAAPAQISQPKKIGGAAAHSASNDPGLQKLGPEGGRQPSAADQSHGGPLGDGEAEAVPDGPSGHHGFGAVATPSVGSRDGCPSQSASVGQPHSSPTEASPERPPIGSDSQDTPEMPDGLCPDAEKLYVLWQEVVELHQRVWDEMAWSSRQMKAAVYSKQELVDIGFIYRELENLFDDWRKDSKARKELAGKLIAKAVLQAAEGVNDLQASTVVQGILASASPDVSMVAEIPKLGTPEFLVFAAHFGISKEHAENPLFPFSIHWKRAMEILEERQTAGKPIPPGFGKQFPNFWAKFVRKRKKKS